MVDAERNNNILDEKTAEGGTCTSFRRSSESNSLQDSTRTALALNGCLRRSIVFKVFTLKFDACQKLVLPLALPMHESDRGIQVGPGVCNLDNLKQASPTPSILFKFDMPKEWMIRMPDCGSSGKAFVVSGCSSRGNATGQSRKNKRCKSVKNFSTICLQNSVLPNVSSCLICDGSNLVIHSSLANRNLTVSKPMKRNLKKTKKKGKQHKRLLHCGGSVGLRNVSEESVCDVSPSPPEEVSEDVPSEEPTSNSLPGKVLYLKKNDNNDQSTGAVKPYGVTVKYIPSTDETNASEQMAALSDEFAREDLGCKQTIHESFTNISNYSSVEQTSERAISTSCRNTYAGNLDDMSLYSSLNRNNDLTLDTVLDNGHCDNTACRGADVESHLFIDKVSFCGYAYAECAMTCNSQQDIAPQCITSNSCKANHKKPNNFQTCDPCSSEDPAMYNIDDRTRCSSQACSSSTSNAFSPVKRGRNSRRVSGKFYALHKFGDTNTYARTRKEVNHPVWQRVQKNSGEESIYELKDPNSLPLQHDSASQVTESGLEDDASLCTSQSGNGELVAGDSVSVRMMKSAADTTKHLSKSSGKLVSQIPEKLKMKSISVPKQGLRKGPQNSKNDLAQLAKKKKYYAVGSSSVPVPDTDSQMSDVSPIKKASNFPSEPWAQEKNHANEMTPVHTGDMVHNIDSYVARDDIHLLAKTLDSLDVKCTPEANCDVSDAKRDEDMRHSFCHLTDKKSPGRKAESGGSHAEHGRQDSNSLPALLKWVPVGKRDESRSKLKNVSFESIDYFSSELDGVTDKPQCSPHHMPKAHVSSDFHFIREAEGGSFNFETDLSKIIIVVKEAYKLQIASETFQLANGSPLAEFERLLYSASPVLGQMLGIWSCKACSQDQLVGDTLCWHQVPNISLRNLWQWYEKPGNYGLEVKVEDCRNPEKVGNDKIDFHAYFAPYLSAVQLFGCSARCTCCDSCISDGKIKKEHEADNMSKNSSQLSNLPMFSLLVSRPRKEAVTPVLDSPPPSLKDEPCNDSICKKCLMAQGLLFEYFESDQPQLRRPLFEKIKELVKGNSISNSQTFGDPSKLECLNLHDLHPASWFSVAWYPIYRIPDGSFRAAFLTYHSLGHFIRRNASVKSADGVSHIVSPVVGLQSYNAKGECWFRQRESPTVATRTGGLSTLMPSEILTERLRTLEATAAVMSRASVPKGDQTSANRQPDHEFFLSRRS